MEPSRALRKEPGEKQGAIAGPLEKHGTFRPRAARSAKQVKRERRLDDVRISHALLEAPDEERVKNERQFDERKLFSRSDQAIEQRYFGGDTRTPIALCKQ
jgi:hypothetical protein